MIQRISANVSINEVSSDAFIQETSLSITQFCAHSTVLDDNPLKRDFRKGVYIYICAKGELTALLTLIASAIFGDTKKLYL